MKIKKQNNLKNDSEKVWKNIKIKGNVISDEGIGLEGLIGLEVLKSYNPDMLTKGKKQFLDKKRKSYETNSSDDNNFETDSDEEKTKPKKKKKPKRSKQKENVPGKFVLLNQAINEECLNENDKEESSMMDTLDGWNGLGVPDCILKALAERNFNSPTQIQALTLPAAIMGKKDIIGAAETGSGKTLAFGIPILAGIMELKRRNLFGGIRKGSKKIKINEEERENLTPPPEDMNGFPDDTIIEESASEDESDIYKPLYALILTPTRELAVQIRDHLIDAAKYCDIEVVAIFGGLSESKQERVLKKCPEIVVATPGRFWELMNRGNSHLNKIDDVSFLVIDETDRMTEKGHFEELELLLNRLNSDEGNKETRQNFVFSATLSLVHDLPDHLLKKNIGKRKKLKKLTPEQKIENIISMLGISQPKIVDITTKDQIASNLTESRIVCAIDEKDYFLYYFLQKHPGRTIVFCNSIDCVKRLSQLFRYLNCLPLPLHAQMMQKQRLKNVERFRDNPMSFLIATDVAARGLDIPDVLHVVHYQVPRTSENYVHRSGRTARANKEGLTIILMEPTEQKTYLKLCKTLDKTNDIPLFPVSEIHMKGVKDRVNLARELDKMELKLSRENTEQGWLKKTIEEMDIIFNESDGNISTDDEGNLEKSKEKRLLYNKRQALGKLLSKPLFTRSFSSKYPTFTGKLQLPFADNLEVTENNSAVKVMKDTMEEIKNAKRNRNKRKRL